MAETKYIGLTALGKFLEHIKGVFAGKDELPQPPGDPDVYYNGEGDWTKPKGTGGGGSAGPLWLEVDENGDLYAYYDDGSSAPLLEYDEESGNLYAVFETEE